MEDSPVRWGIAGAASVAYPQQAECSDLSLPPFFTGRPTKFEVSFLALFGILSRRPKLTATRLQTSLILLPILLSCSQPVCGEPPEKASKPAIEAASPDGRFAFRYVKDSKSSTDTDSESGLAKQTYDLVDKRSGKVLMGVAESDPDLGPSARFNIEKVLWKPDSKAFALTAFLWKRGSSVSVFFRDGSIFHETKLPDLAADIPDKVKRGKSFQHVSELSSQKAIRWQKDGSLVVEIETIEDGNEEGFSITANRTVVLGFDRSDKARVLKSTIKFAFEKN